MKSRTGFALGIVAATLAVVSALGSVAPFTAAVMLSFFSLPASVLSVWLGAWRLGLFGFYWSLLSMFAFPSVVPPSLERVLFLAFALGLVLGVALYWNFCIYRKAQTP